MNKIIATLILSSASVFNYAYAQSTSESKVWTLEECIKHAVENNISIRKAELGIKQSKISLHTSKWAFSPNLNTNVGQSFSWGRSASPADNSYKDINNANTNFGVSASMPIFTGLQLETQLSISKLNLQESMEQLNAAKEDISINVTSAYYNAMFSKEQHELMLHQEELSKQQAEKMRIMFEAGKVAKPEVANIEARLAQDRYNTVRAESQYKNSILELAQLLELASPESILLSKEGLDSAKEITEQNIDEVYTNTVINRATVKAESIKLESTKKNIKMAQSQLFPQIYLSGGLGTSYYTLNGTALTPFSTQLKNNLNKYIGINLGFNIFDRFSTKNRIRTAKLQHTFQALQLEEVKKRIYKEVQQAWYEMTSAKEKLETSKTAVESAQLALELTTEKLNLGKSTVIEYNEAKNNLTKMQSEHLQAKYNYMFRKRVLKFYQGLNKE